MIDPEEIFCGHSRGVISLTGGGGKTSLMFHLARHLAAAGKKVLTTTTTRIFRPTAEQCPTVLVAPQPAGILAQAADLPKTERHLTAAAGHLPESAKLKGFAAADIDAFAASGTFDWILVEGDGSARRPLKAPAGHEPVIPRGTTIQLAVAGLEVIGRPLSADLVFRAELAGPRMGLAPGDPIDEIAMVRLMAHAQGFFKNTPPGAKRLIFLNKADTRQRRASGARIAVLLRKLSDPPADYLLVGQALETLRIHSIHRLRENP